MAVYSTLLVWTVAILFHQIAEGHNLWFIALSLLIVTGIYGGLHLLGKREKMVSNIVFAPPIRKNCCE